MACYLKEDKNIFLSQIKSGNNKLDFEEIKLVDLDTLADPTLAWSTKETFLLKTAPIDGSQSANLYLFGKQSLLKKIEGVNAFSFLVKDQNQFLVYAKYLGTSVRLLAKLNAEKWRKNFETKYCFFFNIEIELLYYWS